MSLKYENTQTTEARQPEQPNSGTSPLYGDSYMPQPVRVETLQPSPDVHMLREPEVVNALKYAEKVYAHELMRIGYSPLTVGTYSSSVGRFIQFLELGRVIPDREQ